MTDGLEEIWQQTRPAFAQTRTWQNARRYMLGSLACFGRRTVTGIICAQAAQYSDWSKVYRLFERERFDQDKLFAPVRSAVCHSLPPGMPIFGALDDTIIRKSGRKIAGTSLRRDPLGPAYRPNFVWAQRFVQASLIAPVNGVASQGRGIPVDIVHAPTPKKPRKNASEEERALYRKQQEAMRVSKVGAERIAHLRKQLNQDPDCKDRSFLMSVDGGYTNRTVFKSVPEATTLIGRIRKDARLFAKPEPPEQQYGQQTQKAGRKRLYGTVLPTPEQIRQDQSIEWQQVKAYAAGKVWDFEVKTIKPVRWKSRGGHDIQVVVVRPIGHRRTKRGRMEYREPAYLACTDPQLPIEQLLQAYLWRWEIEVNFREEKTIMGTGQAQVRKEAAVENTTAFAVASYAMLHAAAMRIGLNSTGLPPPKWRSKEAPKRPSTNQLISQVRAEMWGSALGVNFNGFANAKDVQRSLQNTNNGIGSAVLYATG